jgi:hypothetical protein
MKKISHLTMHEVCGLRFVGEPDEGKMLWGCSVQELAVLSPGFAHLAFGSVAIHSVFEMALADRHQHLHFRGVNKSHPERKCCQ